MGFDEWIKKQGQPVSNFLRRECYDAGAASQHAEVDKLKQALNSALQANKNVCLERDVLQKRINKAVDNIEEYYGVVELSMVVDILKGDQS